jgi:tRNA A-37 threonylcarbamoyl transferase component Bud32
MTQTKESQFLLGGFRWHLCDSLSPTLAQEICQAILAPDSPRQTIKQTPHREVTRFQVDGLDLHVKHYHGDSRERARQFFRGSRAKREFQIGREALHRGVPTVEVLGWSEALHTSQAESYLITRTLPDTMSMLDWLEQSWPLIDGAERWALLHELGRELGRLLARAHRAGLSHQDLHPGNILLRREGMTLSLWLIDLLAATLGPPMDWAASRENLVVLDRWLSMRWNRSGRRRVLRAYFRQRDDLILDERSAARELAVATRNSIRQQMISFDNRCRGGNRHYRRLQDGAMSGYAVTELGAETIRQLMDWGERLAHPSPLESIPASMNPRMLKCSPSSQVVEIEIDVDPAGAKKVVILKRFRGPSIWRSLASLFRVPAALRSYLFGHAFRLRGLPTPRPLAVWQETRWGVVKDGYLVLEKVPQALQLNEFVASLNDRPTAERRERLRTLLHELGWLLRRLHEWQFSHRDLKAANLLVSPADWVVGARGVQEKPFDPEIHRDRIWFIDLVGLRRFGKLGEVRRMCDLRRLLASFHDNETLSRTDRLRVLRAYLNREEFLDWKRWWREIDKLAQQKIARNARLGRVLG